MKLNRTCPKCDREISYTTQKILNAAIKKGSYCVTCQRTMPKSHPIGILNKNWKGGQKVSELKKQAAQYGLTVDDYNQMFAEQKGCCKICHKHQSEFKERLSIDHCHTSGKVRGLLCNKCNRGLGFFDDSIALIQSALTYLMP